MHVGQAYAFHKRSARMLPRIYWKRYVTPRGKGYRHNQTLTAGRLPKKRKRVIAEIADAICAVSMH